MTDPNFFLALNLSGADPSTGMIRTVAASVFEKLGCKGETVDEALRELDAELGRAAASGPETCEIQFRVEAGNVAIGVRSAGGREWRLTRPLPPAD